jgi:hypothetical protein
MLGFSGEIAYISKRGGVGGCVCDINSDGLQDIFIAYAGMAPQFFFNRGFRSFGHAHKPIDLGETQVLPDAGNGQQAGVVADLTGDGVQDMAIVLAKPKAEGEEDTEGQVWVLPRLRDADSTPCVRVALPLGKGYAGPLTVTAQNEQRHAPMGAWNVVPGTGEAFLALPDPGKVKIRWRLPGGKPEELTVEVEDEPVRIVIGQKK